MPLTFEIPIAVKPLPVATASNGGPYTIGQTIELTASGGEAYHWSGPRSFHADTPAASIPEAGMLNAGTYTVKVTSEKGCSKTAQTEVKIEPILAASGSHETWLKVFPNPARGMVKYETLLAGESQITFYNSSGRVVLSKLFWQKGEAAIDFPSGIYSYRFRNGNREVSGKIAVE